VKSLVVSIHDVAPASLDESRRWLAICETYGCRASLLVIPGTWRGNGPLREGEFADWIRSASSRGHEVVMHGVNHATYGRPCSVHATFGRVLARGCEEFWSLEYVEARERVLEGLAAFGRIGLCPRGFVPPGWLLSHGALNALRATGFEYTTTHFTVLPLDGRRRIRSFALSQRPGGPSSGVAATVTRSIGFVQRRVSTVVRIALHPDDLRSNQSLNADIALISGALSAGFTSLTYSDLVRGIEPQQEISDADFLALTS
jgi:predicted deacetylase